MTQPLKISPAFGKKQQKKERPPRIPVSDLSIGQTPPMHLRMQSKIKNKELVLVDQIVGVVSQNHLIDSDFRPKPSFVNKRFRKVWLWVHRNKNSTNFDSQTIILAKLEDNSFYVLNGLRRVCAIKQTNIVKIDAQVSDFRHIYKRHLERQKDIKNTQLSFKPIKPKHPTKISPVMQAKRSG